MPWIIKKCMDQKEVHVPATMIKQYISEWDHAYHAYFPPQLQSIKTSSDRNKPKKSGFRTETNHVLSWWPSLCDDIRLTSLYFCSICISRGRALSALLLFDIIKQASECIASYLNMQVTPSKGKLIKHKNLDHRMVNFIGVSLDSWQKWVIRIPVCTYHTTA